MTGNTGRKKAGILFFILFFAGGGHSFGAEQAMSSRLKEIEYLFNNFNSDTLDLADDFYDPDVSREGRSDFSEFGLTWQY